MTDQAAPTASQTLAALAEQYWAFECHALPLSAVLAGQPLADAVLFRESAADHQRRDHDAAQLLQRAEQIDAGALGRPGARHAGVDPARTGRVAGAARGRFVATALAVPGRARLHGHVLGQLHQRR
jgi:hypothetical protein